MISLFASPKAFRGRIGVIQENAIGSWTHLTPPRDIMLLGDAEGVAVCAARMGVHHVPAVECNPKGTPLVNALFESAERLARHPVIGYVNADIILLKDFVDAIQRVAVLRRPWLLVGRRHDLDIRGKLDFARPDWEETLRRTAHDSGRLHPASGIDYFVYPRGLWPRLPPFALGRTAWDQWLIFEALRRGARVIDGTSVICAVHQNHDYTHAGRSKAEMWSGEEAQQNRRLAGRGCSYSIVDARWRLTSRGLRRTLNRESLGRSVENWDLMHPRWRGLRRPLRWLWTRGRQLRGLTSRSVPARGATAGETTAE